MSTAPSELPPDALPEVLPAVLPGVLHERIVEWYDANARELPWRGEDATPWAVLVSELMLQQTPVARVIPVFADWMERWPTPAALAAAAPGEAVRRWGRLGYPRRALRLHAAAVAVVERHGGEVPADHAALLDLPGVGEYTAAAVASFAFGGRHAVLDTNVRRVLARLVGGQEQPAPSLNRLERERAAALLPEVGSDVPAAAWAIGLMELGALVCTASSPACERCPVLELCAWQRAGRPAYDGPARKVQTYAGTDRQCRGRLLAVLREASGSVTRERLDAVWDVVPQRDRALASLIEDGLVVVTPEGRYALP
ncbi:MAG: A/G-specific adenine glycosylase [Marmoricola sp.]